MHPSYQRGGGDFLAPVFMALLVLAAAGWLVVWHGGRVASFLTGNGYVAPPVGDGEAIRRAFTVGPPSLWPAVPSVAVWAGIAAHVVVLFVLFAVGLAVSSKGPPAGAGTGRAHLTSDGVVSAWSVSDRAAKQLRPSIGKRSALTDRGLIVGRIGRNRLLSNWESTVLAIMPPRAGKTASLAIPAVLDSPGAVVATSNKPDLLAATAVHRATLGTVWAFDPQDLAHQPPMWWWDPLGPVADLDDALALASHFIPTGQAKDPFWPLSARELLALLMLAAVDVGAPIAQVAAWLNTESTEPLEALRRSGRSADADALARFLDLPAETRGGVFANARSEAQSLRSDRMAPWVNPSDGRPQFDPATFVTSSDTLYLMSEDAGQGSASPMIAAFVAELFNAATAAAVGRPGGRLDPPVVAVLDEAANICKLETLPGLYSHLGSRGVVPVMILQSYAQGRGVWGADGMAALWTASNTKVIGAVDDHQQAKAISDVVGTVRVQNHSQSRSSSGVSSSVSWRDEPIISPGEVARIEKYSALVMGSAMPPGLVQLVSWEHGPHADAVSDSFKRFAERMVVT